jgi:hypothetical protein
MWTRIKQYLLIAAGCAALYFLMSYHIIFDPNANDWMDLEVHLLEKSSLHLHYTFYSISNKKPETIMAIDHLREDGIGELLVDIGMISEDERSRLETKFEYE